MHQSLLLQQENSNGRNAFHFACQHGAQNCVRYLVQNYRQQGNSVDQDGLMPVHYAAKHGSIAVMRHLLQHCSTVLDSDDKGRSVLHFAAMSPSLECLHVAAEKSNNLLLQDST